MAFAAMILALMAVGVHAGCDGDSYYTPYITHRDLEGKTTATTFVLEQPRCNFTCFEEDDRIWLVVARSSDADKFNSSEDPINVPYQSFGNNSYYMTLNTAAVNYPCTTSDEITVLRVGTETSCVNDTTRPNCNGPLPDPGPYRVRFIARRPNGTVTCCSRWSKDITLVQARDYTTIHTSPGQRNSKAMIAITAILSVLFAILLASFISLLIYKYTNNCGNVDITNVREAATVTRYTTHHMYSHPTSKS